MGWFSQATRLQPALCSEAPPGTSLLLPPTAVHGRPALHPPLQGARDSEARSVAKSEAGTIQGMHTQAYGDLHAYLVCGM